jgi:predicted dehydrogenase
MNTPARVGVVGCGVIAHNYIRGSAAFDSFELVACADLNEPAAAAFAAEHGLHVSSVDDLIADPGIDAILNLTPPSAHAAVVSAAFAHGKHVYTEKPLATSVAAARDLVAAAAERGLRLACAPDTFLGSAYEAGRGLIERGAIGEPLGATATMLVGGPDGWHPNADVFYRDGGGPMLDIAPYYLTAVVSLLGPFVAASGFAATPTPVRRLGVGPRAGEEFSVDVPTHVSALLRLERGPLLTLTVSFEATEQYESSMVVHGSEGTLELPDANAFEGEVRVKTARGELETVAYESRGPQETRGLGLHELFESLQAARPHRASAELGLHVLESATAVLDSAREGRTVEIASRVGQATTQAQVSERT